MDRQKTFANYEQQLYILQQEKHIVISDAASAQNILEQIGELYPLSRTDLKLESHAFGQIQNSDHRYIIFHIKRKSTTRTFSAS